MARTSDTGKVLPDWEISISIIGPNDKGSAKVGTKKYPNTDIAEVLADLARMPFGNDDITEITVKATR